MKHQTISFIKSGLRMLGYLLIPALWWTPFGDIPRALSIISSVLVISEAVGIWEEFGHE